MEDSVLEMKLGWVDVLEKKFHAKTTVFAQEVKTKMKTQPKDVASQCFEVALLFLSQVFPNLDDLKSASVESGSEASKIDDKLEEVDEKLKELDGKLHEQHQLLERKYEDFKTDFTGKLISLYDDFSDHKSKLETVEYEFDKKFLEIKDSQEESKSDVAKLNAAAKANAKSISGLRKLQTIFKWKMEESKTTATPTSTDQSFGASAAAATTSSRSPLSLSQRKSFKIRGGDCIYDAKLLSDSLFLVADWSKCCVRLLSTEGKELDTLELDQLPFRLAILEERAGNSWEVAVCIPGLNSVDFFKVNGQTLSKKSTITTQREYHILAKLDSTTLAAGYSLFDDLHGVDFIDHSGNLLNIFCSGLCPHCMVATQDQHLLIFNSNKFYKFKVQGGGQDKQCKVPQINWANSMTSLQNDSYIVADQGSRVLHLVSGDGQAIRELWNHPNGADGEDPLSSVTVMGDVCICSCLHGSIFVLEI